MHVPPSLSWKSEKFLKAFLIHFLIAISNEDWPDIWRNLFEINPVLNLFFFCLPYSFLLPQSNLAAKMYVGVIESSFELWSSFHLFRFYGKIGGDRTREQPIIVAFEEVPVNSHLNRTKIFKELTRLMHPLWDNNRPHSHYPSLQLLL